MKKTAILIASLLLTTGCAASPQVVERERNSPPAETRASFKISEDASCNNLLSDDGGLMSEASIFLRDLDSMDDEIAAEAQRIADDLDAVAQNSSERLSELLVIMQEPFLDLVAANQNGESFDLDPARYKAAGFELTSICDGSGENAVGQDEASEPTTLRISSGATCQLLLGANEDGPLIEGVNFIADLVQRGQEVSSDEVKTSRKISDELNAILETANDDLRPYIEEVVKPLDMLAAEGSTGIHVDMTTFKAASVELLTQCP